MGESGLYRPLTTLSYLFNYALLGNGGDPTGYHWINLLLHVCNAMLLWTIARRFFDSFWPPVLIAAVWAVHPVLTESVTNIVGRADLLAGTAVLGGLLMYLKSTETSGRRCIAWLSGLAAITAAGVFSKESAVTIVGVLLLFEAAEWRSRRQVRGLLWGCVAVVPPILWMLYQRGAVLAASAPTVFPFTDNPLVAADFWSGRATAIAVIGRYLALLAWPARLSCDYSYAQIPLTGPGNPAIWLGIAAAAAGMAALWRWQRTGFFLAAAAFLAFLPTSNLIFAFGTIMAERFLYLPSIAFAAGVVWLAYATARRMHAPAAAAPAALCLLIAIFAVRTHARNADWHDDLALSTSAVRVSARSLKAHKLRANALLESHADLDQVIAEADQALAILNPLPDGRNDFDMYDRAGGYYSMKGDLQRRLGAPDEQWYQRALDLFQRCDAIARATRGRCQGVDAHLAKLYLHLGRHEQALDAAAQARVNEPGDPETYRVQAGLLLDDNREHEAADALLEGYLRTRNQGLLRALVDLYRSGGDAKGCEAAAARVAELASLCR